METNVVNEQVRVAVLGGGPDAEREVSLVSSQSVADALAKNSGFVVQRHVIGRITREALTAIRADVLFPVLHGGFGEGGPLQDLMELDGRPFVGCRSHAARLCMDKLASKLTSTGVGLATKLGAVFNPRDLGCPLSFPVVVKPIHEGSSVGVHFASSPQQFAIVSAKVKEDMTKNSGRSYMIEEAVMGGRELTVGVLDGKSLPVIEIKPRVAFYDYEAKYNRDDTQYVVSPELPAEVELRVRSGSEVLARAIGIRHLCRVDFLLDKVGVPWFLEVNTMPGFTGHSLLPMAAAKTGLDMTQLTTRLVEIAIRDHRPSAAGQQ